MTKELDEEEFPSNSKMTVSKRQVIDVELKENPELIKSKTRRVVKGRRMIRKKSPGSNFIKAFLGDDISSVGEYIIHEVLIPAAKDTLRDVVSGGIERLLFGEGGHRSHKRDRDSGRTIVSYGQYYKDDNRRTTPRHKRTYSGRSRPVEEVIIENRGEANDALEALQDMLDEYQVVSVSDMYEIVGYNNNDWTNSKWGWDDLRDARVVRVHEGYLLDLPDTIHID